MKHAKLNASSSKRWMMCPGSIPLTATIPEGKVESSVYAREGTAAHELAERMLNSGGDAVQYLGDKIDGFEVTEEMVDSVNLYLETIRNDLEEAGLKKKDLKIEKKFNLNWIQKGMFGTNDCSFGEPFGVLRIYDLKYGAGQGVEVANNTQLMYYALGAAHGEDYEEIEMVIIQPRYHHEDGPVRRWRITSEQLDRFAKNLKEAALATKRKNAPLSCGDWCTWCPCIPICPEMHKTVVETTQEDFSKPLPKVETLPIEKIVKILTHEKTIKKFFEEAKAFAHHELSSGREMEGLKLVKKRAIRSWTNEGEVVNTFFKTHNTQIYNMKLKSPKQLEDTLGKDFKDKIAEFVTKPDNGTTIALEGDRRKAVEINPAKDFEGVE